jgi:hypothetical protein
VPDQYHFEKEIERENVRDANGIEIHAFGERISNGFKTYFGNEAISQFE